MSSILMRTFQAAVLASTIISTPTFAQEKIDTSPDPSSTKDKSTFSIIEDIVKPKEKPDITWSITQGKKIEAAPKSEDNILTPGFDSTEPQ